MGEVARVVTPHSRLVLAEAIRDAHCLAFGGPPPLSRWAGLCGHLFLEQGNGLLTNNDNAGNVTASEAWRAEHDYFGMAVPPPDPPHLWFRAYAGPVHGCEGYLKVMAGSYLPALQRFDRGDYAGGCAALKAKGYMLASLEPYSKAVVSLANWAASELLPPLIGENERPALACDEPDCDGELRSYLTTADINAVLALNYQSLQQLGWEAYDEARRDARETVPDR